MLDDLIDGLLEALYNGTMEECKNRYNSAIKVLNDSYAESRRIKVAELTRVIKEIDRNIKKVEYKTRIMDISDYSRKKIIEATIDSFKKKRDRLRLEKKKISYRSTIN